MQRCGELKYIYMNTLLYYSSEKSGGNKEKRCRGVDLRFNKQFLQLRSFFNVSLCQCVLTLDLLLFEINIYFVYFRVGWL